MQVHTSNCEYVKVSCVHTECGAVVKKAFLPEHLKAECVFRLVTCELCSAQLVYNKLMVCLFSVYRFLVTSSLSQN